MTGFFAVDCAAAGLGSDAGALLDVFQQAYGHGVAQAELTRPPGHWAILDGYHRDYAACQYTHASIEATAELAPSVAGRLDQILEVRVKRISWLSRFSEHATGHCAGRQVLDPARGRGGARYRLDRVRCVRRDPAR